MIFVRRANQVYDGSKKNIHHKNIEYRFSVPNELNEYRLEKFPIKEPETLAWINQFKDGSVYYDFGANVGLYSIYASKI